MTREIKFRAWHKKAELMRDMDNEDSEFYFSPDASDHDLAWAIESDAVEVMQYTGLKDKNGVEIYEGDIVSAGNLSCVVEWYRVGWAAKWGEFVRGAGMSYRKPELGFREHEVIGNIHETPELLDES